MSRRILACVCLLLIAGVAGCSDRSHPADASVPDVRLDEDGFVKVRFAGMKFLEQDLAGGDGSMRLHADIYLPDDYNGSGEAPTKFPTILLLSPYWGAGTQGDPTMNYIPYDFLWQRLLPRGYAIVYGDLGGNGGSSGCWDFMGPVERASAYGMVEAIAAQDWSDGQVGMFGLSYDAMTQIMASSDAAPHLVTVVPASGLTEAYKGLKMWGVHYGGGWHQTIAGYEQSSLAGPGPTNEPRRDGWLETVQQSPECLAGNHEGDAATGAYSAWFKERDFRPFAPEVKASVFVTQGFEDAAVKPDNYGAWFQGITTEKKLWIGHWFHQYPTAQNAGRADMVLTFHRWFDHTLMHVDNGIDSEPVVDVQDSLGQWRHEDAWPPTDARPTNYSISSDGALTSVVADAKSGGVPVGGPLSASEFLVGDGGGAATFRSGKVAGGLHIAGTPVVDARFLPGGSNGYVVARLYDGDRMVSQGSMNAIFANGLEAPQPLQPSMPVHLRFAMYPTDWTVEPGHELRLVLNTMDGAGWFDPDPEPTGFTLLAGADAVLELPTIERDASAVFLTQCGAIFDGVVDCYDDKLKDAGVPEAP
jgi:predicted acyl esterase